MKPAIKESEHPNRTRLPITNQCGETWEDILAFLKMFSNRTNSMKQETDSRRSDIAEQSLDPVAQQVVREQVVTEQFSTKSLVFATLHIFDTFGFLNIALSTIALPLYHI